MELVQLKDIGKILSGSTPSRKNKEYFKGNINWFTPKDLSKIEGKYLYEAPEKITEGGYNSCSTNLLPANSLLFTSRAPIGHIAINKNTCCTNQGFKSIIPDESKINIDFLYYAISRYTPEIKNLGRGATFAELSKSDFEKVQIPLPPLKTQQRIAEILDNAAALRDKTAQLLTEYDLLAQSIFLDMFGDPVSNPKGWETEKLKDICGVGSSRRVFVDELVESGIPFYRGKEIGALSSGKSINPDLFITQEHYNNLAQATGVPQIGDLLMPSICPDGRIYRVSNDTPFYFKDGRVLWIKVDQLKVNSYYLIFFLRELFRTNYSNIASGTTFAELKIVALKKIKTLLAPIELQNQFAEKIGLIEQQKALAKQELKEAEDLFNCLLQKAFKGELV